MRPRKTARGGHWLAVLVAATLCLGALPAWFSADLAAAWARLISLCG